MAILFLYLHHIFYVHDCIFINSISKHVLRYPLRTYRIEMDSTPSMLGFIFLMFIIIVCSPGSFSIKVKEFEQKEQRRDEQIIHLIETVQHNFVNPSVSTFPTSPVTNPVTVTFPPDTSTPGGVVPVPSFNPVTVTPVSTPVTFPPATPITNPANPALPVTNPVTTPSTTFPGGNNNPATTYPAPVVAQPVTANAPATPGQSWCVVRSGVPEQYVQTALDYACGIGGADCSAIQQGANCYNPNTMQNHASYAFNSYYQKNPVQTSCDFGGTAFITNVNPSSGSCIYPTYLSSVSPNTMSPITTNPTSVPTTASSSGANPVSSGTPTVFTTGNPAFGGTSTGFGEIPPAANATSTSISNRLQPFIGCIIIVAAGNLFWT